ncbi:MAG: ATP-dependent RecD-like DNA helicase [Clostridia bacterium]
MIIKGEIVSIIFQNLDNGWTVMELNCNNEIITAVGSFPELYAGATVELSGDYKYHTKHGLQFMAESGTILPPTDVINIEKYLKSGFFRGIGAITASAIVKTFGAHSLEIIEHHPDLLSKVKGISYKRAVEISNSFSSQKEMQETLLYLQRFDISLNLALKIYKRYGKLTERIIKENPYQLIDDIDRVGFVTADRLALLLDAKRDSDFRIRAGINYIMKEAASNRGHTYLPEDELVKYVVHLLEFENDMVLKVVDKIEDMLFLSELMAYTVGGKRVIMLYGNYIIERNIARKLIHIENCHSAPQCDYEKEISKFEEVYNIKLHENQRLAVNNSLISGVHIISGGPGTGKTTIIKCLLFILKAMNRTYSLCAPTGRAAKRMSEATSEQAKTIHRLLDLDFKNGGGVFTFNASTRLPVDVVIVDEVSMVDEYVFSSLISAIRDGSSIILVGDKDQLVSVGAGNVLSDLIFSKRFAVTYLTHIYRQSENSLIITNAHRINNGEMPILNNKSEDFFFIENDNPSDIVDIVRELCIQRIPNYLKINPMDIQVLSPMKKGVAGVINLNKGLRDALNRNVVLGEDIRSGEYYYRVGDKIMQSVNNYDLEWKVYNDYNYEVGRGVFNGEIGYINDINKQDMKFSVTFEDNKVAVYSFGDLDQIIPAYAVSVHKSQGSEFEAVILVLVGVNNLLMTRNLLYTAVTRAKRLVSIVGTRQTLVNMVNNNTTTKRNSLLKEFIAEETNGEKTNSAKN